jgi:Ca2+-binding RTX toxin-like protein
VSLSASTLTLAPNDTDEIVVSIANNGVAAALLTHVKFNLPETMTLLGPPAFESGSGCTGTQAVDCNVDYVPNGSTTHVRFTVRVSGSGAQTITANVSSDRESNPADNQTALTLQVNAPPAPPPPPRSPSTASKGVTRSGSAQADLLVGTARNDTLRGLAGDDLLRGLAGNDRLFGGAGADRLVGGPGLDQLDGGAGNDRFETRDGQRDIVDCGAGRDVVIADQHDVIKENCENVSRR